MSQTNNSNILIGSVTRVLNRRMILGEGVDDTMVSLINVLFKSLEYAQAQYDAGNTDYYEKIECLNSLIFDLRTQCADICNYREFGQLIDYRTSNMNIQVSSMYYRESQLQIIYPPN